ELLLVAWGICFVASRTQTPTHKGRDFIQPIQKGKEIIVSRKRRRSSTSTVTLAAEGFGDEQPYWSATARVQQEATGGSSNSARVISPVGGHPPKSVAATFFRHPTEQDCPRRSFSNSSGPVVTGESSLATGDRGSARQDTQPPSYADCA
ncbi:unnamed protein product, partial [Laminaria digitata]